jgi:hypothetical protein
VNPKWKKVKNLILTFIYIFKMKNQTLDKTGSLKKYKNFKWVVQTPKNWNQTPLVVTLGPNSFNQAFISKLQRARAIIQSSFHSEGHTSSQFLQ